MLAWRQHSDVQICLPLNAIWGNPNQAKPSTPTGRRWHENCCCCTPATPPLSAVVSLTAPGSDSAALGWPPFAAWMLSLALGAPAVMAAMGVLPVRLTEPLSEDMEPEGSLPAPAFAPAAVRLAARTLSAASLFLASSASCIFLCMHSGC